jgi:hypothetical protein
LSQHQLLGVVAALCVSTLECDGSRRWRRKKGPLRPSIADGASRTSEWKVLSARANYGSEVWRIIFNGGGFGLWTRARSLLPRRFTASLG